ncbi:hypothetical protein [Hydrogenovibrio marinus]|uniref:Uncharacterized protein n=1 Tax=Hydrogenovibrio marinus TaxID=28885 RepID=A0A066ZX99_HYDMR|nr:hypothetical protein [Hydrogenovibrio marinus]KDN94690.1 hypothetical protein EI16_12385 [Hydrogenovibrio marinus]
MSCTNHEYESQIEELEQQNRILGAQHNMMHNLLAAALDEIKFYRKSYPNQILDKKLDLDQAEDLLKQNPIQNLADYETKVIEEACDAGREWVQTGCDFIDSSSKDIDLMLTGIAQVSSIEYGKQVQKNNGEFELDIK